MITFSISLPRTYINENLLLYNYIKRHFNIFFNLNFFEKYLVAHCICLIIDIWF